MKRMMNSIKYLLLLTLFVMALGICGQNPASSSEVKQIVFMIGEREYKTKETLPKFAKKHLQDLGHKITFVYPDPENKNSFPGLIEALKKADLLLVSVRRRGLPQKQIQAIKDYVNSGNAIMGIRTSSHAFEPKGKLEKNMTRWSTFDVDVFGGKYSGHFNRDYVVALKKAPQSKNHAIMKGIGELPPKDAHLYKISNLRKEAQVLLIAKTPDNEKITVAWVLEAKGNKGRVFHTTLGKPVDFEKSYFSKFLVNAIQWSLK
jgi:type 1 glutamine amidotransferase